VENRVHDPLRIAAEGFARRAHAALRGSEEKSNVQGHEDRIQHLEYELRRLAQRAEEAERRNQREWQDHREAERQAEIARRDLKEEIERAERREAGWAEAISEVRAHHRVLADECGTWIIGLAAAVAVLAAVALAEAVAIWLLWRAG
jgi:chromosome segregation ATPase